MRQQGLRGRTTAELHEEALGVDDSPVPHESRPRVPQDRRHAVTVSRASQDCDDDPQETARAVTYGRVRRACSSQNRGPGRVANGRPSPAGHRSANSRRTRCCTPGPRRGPPPGHPAGPDHTATHPPCTRPPRLAPGPRAPSTMRARGWCRKCRAARCGCSCPVNERAPGPEVGALLRGRAPGRRPDPVRRPRTVDPRGGGEGCRRSASCVRDVRDPGTSSGQA